MFHFFVFCYLLLDFSFFCAVSIAQLAESRGHRVIFFPRYHCELNMIEMYWGKAKRFPPLALFSFSFFLRRIWQIAAEPKFDGDDEGAAGQFGSLLGRG